MNYEDLPIENGVLDVDKLNQIKFPIKFTFKEPLLGSSIAHTEIREPTIGNVVEANKETDDHEKNLKLLSLIVSNLTPEQVRDIVPQDYYKLLTVVTPFLV